MRLVLALLAFIYLCPLPALQESLLPLKTDQDYVQARRSMDNIVVEEGEIQRINLAYYFRGQLLKFVLTTQKELEPQVQEDLSQLVKWKSRYIPLYSQYITDESYMMLDTDPFPQSSLIIEESNTNRTSLYFVTKELKFTHYDVTQYSKQKGEIHKIQEQQLNLTHKNSLCRDLTYIKLHKMPPLEGFLFFCKGYRKINAQIVSVHTLILIGKTRSEEYSTREYSWLESDMEVVPDFKKGSSGIRYMSEVTFGNQLLYFSGLAVNRTDGEVQQMIMSLNIAPLILAPNQSYQEGPPLILPIQQFEIKHYYDFDLRVLDFLLIKKFNNLFFFVFSVETEGIRICHFTDDVIGNISHPVVPCNKFDARIIVGTASPALYKNIEQTNIWRETNATSFSNEGEFFYGVRYKPPEIVEYEMSDLLNIRMYKKYTLVDNRKDPLVGTRFMAVNKNYVLHMLTDPETQQQAVRVYDRFATNIDSAKFYIQMPSDSLGNFMGFPNRFFDVVIMRDERQVNVSFMGPAQMIMDGTNSTLVNKYKGRGFYMRVIANDGQMSSRLEFSVTFLEKNNNGIYPVQDGILPRNLSVFYNCGEDRFNYLVSKHYDGPNYSLFPRDIENKYFMIENQLLWMTFEHRFNFTTCKRNFIFPKKVTDNTTQWYKNENMVPVLLLCVDYDGKELRSYELRNYRENNHLQYSLEKKGTIKIPYSEFIEFSYDIKERSLLGLVQNVDMIDENHQEDYSSLPSKYVFHIFKVEEEVVWRREQHFSELKNITYFGYNHLLDLGIVIDFDTTPTTKGYLPVERFYVFEFQEGKDEIVPIYTQGFQLTNENEMTLKAIITSEQSLFTMKSEGRIYLYQLSNSLQLVQNFTFPNLINFDVFDNLYFVVYSGSNLIYVYTISNYVQVTYKMTLPLYHEYEDFTFLLNKYSGFNLRHTTVVRTFKEGILAVLFSAPSIIPIFGQNNTQLITFGLEFTQHNAFIMSQEVSQYFPNFMDEEQFANLVFTVSGEHGSIGHTSVCVMSWQWIAVFNAQYYNQLTLNYWDGNREQLQQRCKGMNKTNQDGFTSMQIIDTLDVLPVSLFADKSNVTQQQPMHIQVYSENQGLAILKKRHSTINIAYSEDYLASEKLSILYESYVEGQALRFITECTYFNDQGVMKNCTDQAIEENAQDTPFSFSIEFVTNERKIVKMFTMGNLFFMLDTQKRLNVLRLPKYTDNLSPVNGYPLLRVNESDQVETFGCNLNGWADYYNLTDQQNAQNDSYLFLYQCNNDSSIDGGTWLLRAAIITTFTDAYSESEFEDGDSAELYQVITFEGALQLPYKILDMDKINTKREGHDIEFTLAVSCENDNIESNILYFYKLILFTSDVNRAYFSYMRSFSAYSLRFDTFKVTKLLPVIESGLLFAVCEDYGVHVFNMTMISLVTDGDQRDYLVGTLDIVNDIVFQDQQAKQTDEVFKILSLTFNLPTSVVFITNYGIFNYEFDFDLTNLTEIKQSMSFTYKRYRQISLSYDIFGSEIVRNSYGNAFLAMERVYEAGEGIYRTKLISMSYYSAQNSQIFKQIDIVDQGASDQCIAINQNPYFEYSPEDQIAVTFICNQYLYLFRVCMRPQAIIDLSKIARKNNREGELAYNNFEIVVYATNEDGEHLLDYVNSEMVYINVSFSHIDMQQQNLLVCMAITVAIGFTVVLIFYIDNSFTMGSKAKEEEKAQHQKREVSKYNPSYIIGLRNGSRSTSLMRYRESEAFNMSPGSTSGMSGGILRKMLDLNRLKDPYYNETGENRNSNIGARAINVTTNEQETVAQRFDSRESQSFDLATEVDNRFVAHQQQRTVFKHGIQHDETLMTESTFQ